MKKIILLSGGLDSATLLASIANSDTVALFFNYNQKAYVAELASVEKLAKKYNIPLICRDVVDAFRNSNSAILQTVHQDPISLETKTELEFRNGVFISYAISVAMQLFPLEEVEIMLGLIHINVPYMDCSNTFISLYDKIAKLCSNGKISISAPFIDIGKDIIVKKAKELNLNISDTWSCYDNKDKPCGKCDACIDRKILGVL